MLIYHPLASGGGRAGGPGVYSRRGWSREPIEKTSRIRENFEKTSRNGVRVGSKGGEKRRGVGQKGGTTGVLS